MQSEIMKLRGTEKPDLRVWWPLSLTDLRVSKTEMQGEMKLRGTKKPVSALDFTM